MSGKPGSEACVFCDAAAPDRDPSSGSLVLVRGRLSYVVLNLYPYNNGHLMVVPNRHVGSLVAASDAELDEIMRFVRDGEVALGEVYQPQGIVETTGMQNLLARFPRGGFTADTLRSCA